MNKEINLFHHELLDRLYMITDMYNSFICEHNSNDLLTEEEKDKVLGRLWDQDQLVGERITKNEE